MTKQETTSDAVDAIVTLLPRGSNDIGRQQRQDLRRWLSPPDPSKNHHMARSAHHESTAAWFIEGSVFNQWKSTPSSLLWIHGIRVLFFKLYRTTSDGPRFRSWIWKECSMVGRFSTVATYGLKSSTSSSIVKEVMDLRDSGQASMAYFYFDFRDGSKRSRDNLLRSLLFQLSTQSDRHSDILSLLHSAHGHGRQKPSDGALTRCLKEMLSLADEDLVPVYLIIDAVDECPENSGMPGAREKVLELICDLVGLNLSSLHLCVTSRPEFDIRTTLERLTPASISLHEQSGQKKDIVDYVDSVVYSDTKMRRWREEDKRLVVETLTKKADGM
jgi:hypothetical protein